MASPRISRLLGSLALISALVATPAAATTLRTITVDGNLDDWADVLLDRDHKVSDRSLAQGDPDAPPQSQRDQRAAAFTWDATKLYLYFSRTGAGTNSFNALYYFDLNHDARLSSTDRVLFLKFSGGSFGGSEFRAYTPVAASDAIGGDGATPVGTSGALISAGGTAAAVDPNGIGFEASITWATLGVAAGTPLFIHPALTSNTNLPAGVQDNTAILDTFLPGVFITEGTTKGTAPGRFVDFPHDVRNTGTAADLLDILIRTRLGFSVAVYSDPNGDGNPADGALLQLDANGDADTTDTGDIPPAAAQDANSNRLVDGGLLAAGATRHYVLRVGVPARQALGTEEILRVFVVSSYRPSVRMEAEDHLVVGLLSLTPPRSIAGGPGQSMRLAHAACNQSGVARVLDLSVVASLGWTSAFFSDPNGDGDPTDGAPLSDSDADGIVDVGSVADATCRNVVLVVQVPGGASFGTVNDLTLTASDGAVTQDVADAITVAGSRVDVSPDRTAKSQRGKTIFLQHQVTNAAPTSDTFTMSAASTLGSQVAILNDPDGDALPDGSSVITNTGSVPGNGGSVSTLTRIRIPGSAVHGNVDNVTTEAESDATVDFDTALDRVTVVDLLTYSDALFARPATEFFGQCSTMYVLAFRSGGGTYRFAWYDPSNVLARTSADLTPYADGSLDDFYDGGANPMLGTWTVKLQIRNGGGTYTDVGPSGTGTFEVLDLVAAGARISLNDTGADLYLLSGEPLSAFADLANPTFVDIIGSRVDHVAFFDADGNGAPTAGEDYVRMDGTIAPWGAGLVTATRSPLDVYAGEPSGDRFTTAPVTYTRNGPWTLETRWYASCGFLLSTRTVGFIVGCTPPPTFAGIGSAVDVDPCAFTGVRLDWSVVSSWGLGTGGTYSVYRSDVPGFTPDASNMIASGLTVLTYTDLTAPPDVEVSYVVRAESNTTCADGPNNGGLMDSNFVHVVVTDADFGVVPVVDFTHSSPICLDAGAANVDFTDASSGPPVDLDWDFDGDTIIDASGANVSWAFTSPGDHAVKLIATNPCGTASITKIVTVGQPPVAVLGADRVETCLDETADFDALGSTAFPPATIVAWSWDFDGDTIEDSNVADPPATSFASLGLQRVKLVVTDSLGCTATESVDVTVNPAFDVTLAAAPVIDHCTGDVTLQAAASGGRGPYVYSWDVLTDDGTGLGSATFPHGTTRTATVTVTDAGGCTASAVSVPLTINPQLTVSLGAPTIDPCTGFVTLRATAGGGDGSYTVTWSRLVDDGSGLGSGIVPAGPHVETVTVTDGNGCTATDQLAFDVTTAVSGSFTWSVTYISPDVFRADVSGLATGGVAPHSFSWDVNGDGTVDGTGPTFTFMMGANETIPVELTITDSNSCSALVANDVLSDGCPVDTPLQLLMVRKEGTGFFFSWQDSTHACHGRYGLLEAATAFPADRRNGTFPVDPLWTSLTPEDADGTDQNASFTLADPRAGLTRYYLVRDGGTDGSWGPTESYGNFGVLP